MSQAKRTGKGSTKSRVARIVSEVEQGWREDKRTGQFTQNTRVWYIWLDYYSPKSLREAANVLESRHPGFAFTPTRDTSPGAPRGIMRLRSKSTPTGAATMMQNYFLWEAAE